MDNYLNPPKELEPIFSPQLTKRLEEIAYTASAGFARRAPFQNLLLQGLPGVGKTMVAKKIAKDSGLNYIAISGANFAQFNEGEHVAKVHELFNKINSSSRPTVLFVDEIDVIAPKRGGDQKHSLDRKTHEILGAFLTYTGTPSRKFMLIGATNLPDSIDPALLSRMTHRIKVPLPGLKERAEIVKRSVDELFGKNGRQGLEQHSFLVDYAIHLY